ncbi:MAG: acyl-ACP desaturase [Candidatus Saccharimonas sp.]
MIDRYPIENTPPSELLLPSNVRRFGRAAVIRSGRLIIGSEPNPIQVLRELEPVVERELNRHNSARTPWVPANYMPINQETGYILHRVTDPEATPILSPEAQSAMIVNLLTEDNLPSYHRVIAENFGIDGPWGTWTNQWTAEEGNHAYAMRSFLDLTRAVDPEKNEAMRMEQVMQGYMVEKDPLHTLAYVTFQELATRVSHRQTGKASHDEIAEKMLKLIANDENFHMIFYSNLAEAALDVAPNQMMQAIRDEVLSFEMPGSNIKDFRLHALRIANAGIYDLRRHLKEVVVPILRKWHVFDREDLTGKGAQAREELAAFLEQLDHEASVFEEKRDNGRVGRAILALEKRTQ